MKTENLTLDEAITYFSSFKSNKNKIYPYLLEGIKYSGFLTDQPEEMKATAKEQLQLVADIYFDEQIMNDKNYFKRYGSYQNGLANWFMGLPSAIEIDFENYTIIELAKKWGALAADATERQEDKILDNWFNYCAANLLQLFHKFGVTIKK